MDCKEYRAPDPVKGTASTAAPVPSDRFYQLAALTVVIFMLATML